VFFLELREILSGDSFTINIYYEKGVIINEFEGLIVEVVLFHIDQVLILLVVNVFFFFFFFFFLFFFHYIIQKNNSKRAITDWYSVGKKIH